MAKAKELKIQVTVDKKTGELQILNKELDQVDRSAKRTSSTINNTGSSFVALASKIGLVTTAIYAFKATIENGFDYNKDLENLKAGLVTLSVAIADKATPTTQKYIKANKEATYTLKKLQEINAKTPNTLKETTRLYNAMYVSMKNSGVSTNELIQITEKLSIAAKAGGIEFNSLLAGVDGLANGTVLANSDLGRFLASLGLTNEKLKNSTDKAALLQKVLGELKVPDTFDTAVSNLSTEWDDFTGKLSKPLFDEAKKDIKIFTQFLTDNKDAMLEFAYDIGRIFKLVANGYEAIYKTTLKGYLELTLLFKEQINTIINYVIDTIQQTNNYWSNTWIGQKAGIKPISLKHYVVDTETVKKEIDDITDSIANLGNMNDDLVKKILNNTVKLEPGKSTKDDYNGDSHKKKEETIDWNTIDLSPLEKYKDQLWKAELAKQKQAQQESLDLQKQALDAIKEPIELVNEKYLKMYDVVKDIFSTEQMTKFYAKWSKELDTINKKSAGYKGVGTKDFTDGLKGQYKSITNVSRAFENVAGEQKKWTNYSKENTATEADKNKHLNDQIGLWGDVAGAVGSMAEEGSAASKVALVAQTSLAVAQGVSAIMNQGSGDPYTAIPRMVAMGAMVASTLSTINASVKGGANIAPKDYTSTINSASFTTGTNVSLKDYDGNFDKFMEGLDKASERLEKFGNVGTSLGDSLETLKNNLDDLHLKEAHFKELIDQYGEVRKEIIKTKARWEGIFYHLGSTTTLTYRYGDSLKIIENQMDQIKAELGQKVSDSLADSLNFDDYTVKDAKNLIGDFDITKYQKILDEINAFAIKAKKNGGELDFADNIALADLYQDELYKTGQDYTEVIKIITDALQTSKNNIKTWNDSFKNPYQIAQDMASKLNVTLATSLTGLSDLFKQLSEDVDGLTDSDLELLQANKDLIESNKQAINDAWLGEYSPLSLLQKTQYATSIATGKIQSNLSPTESALLALQTAKNTATTDEQLRPFFDRYIASLTEQEPDATRTDIVEAITTTNITLNDVIDRLERIEQ
jgi:archaellum component FlaC